MTSNRKPFTVTREMFAAVARHLSITWLFIFHRFDLFALLYNKSLNHWHRAKSRVSVFLKRGGNMQLHVSVMFTFCGNVKNAYLRDSVTFPERKCQVTFPSYLSHQISAVVRFCHVSANGFAVVCYIYQNTNARWFFEQQHFNQ